MMVLEQDQIVQSEENKETCKNEIPQTTITMAEEVDKIFQLSRYNSSDLSQSSATGVSIEYQNHNFVQAKAKKKKSKLNFSIRNEINSLRQYL